MITSAQFCIMLKNYDFNFFTGVPCTILKDIINYLSNNHEFSYITANREDEALGLATGAYLTGRKPVVFMQNSGLGNSINALTSLAILYKIPILLVISWRGYLGKDAPEHLIIGSSVTKLLEDIGIHTEIISKQDTEKTISASVRILLEKQIPVALLIKEGILE